MLDRHGTDPVVVDLFGVWCVACEVQQFCGWVGAWGKRRPVVIDLHQGNEIGAVFVSSC